MAATLLSQSGCWLAAPESTPEEDWTHWNIMILMFCELLPLLDDDELDELISYPYDLKGRRVP